MQRYRFSERVRELRASRRVTQEALANGVGVSQSTISAWELNERYPSLDKAYDIANFFGVPISSLI